jgi:hypothetical protein
MADETITPGEFDRWVPIKRAVEQVSEHAPAIVIDLLVGRINSGSIPVALRDYFEFSEGGQRTESHFVVKHGPRWIQHVGDRFWEAGDHTISVARDSTGYSGHRVFAEIHGTRLAPDAVAALLREIGPSLPNPVPPPFDNTAILEMYGYKTDAQAVPEPWKDAEVIFDSAPPKHNGGRPPLSFWEDALIAVAYEIHLGDFKPARQADVQRRLSEWIAEQGHDEPGATQTKARAKKLWDRFSE